ncbi:MAG: ATP-binding protein [Bryobacteraceae bacterium]
MLFQVIAGRAEWAAVIVTTNLPFSEWATKFPNARLCKAMLDRLTDRPHCLDRKRLIPVPADMLLQRMEEVAFRERSGPE